MVVQVGMTKQYYIWTDTYQTHKGTFGVVNKSTWKGVKRHFCFLYNVRIHISELNEFTHYLCNF